MNQRVRQGHGIGLGGTQIRDRLEKREADRIESARSPRRGAAPMADPRVSGSKTAHRGTHGAPDVYFEQYGGRRGGKGKRTS